jgi:hypothetical protein
MLATTETPVVYGCTGGSPPSTFEVLTIRSDGEATYATGNPWPKQPPFDEIGTYREALSADDLELVRTWLRRAVPSAAEYSTASGSADAGLEYVEALLDETAIVAHWVPPMVPLSLEPVVDVLRKLVGRIRSNPVRTLQGRLEASLSASGKHRLRIWLDNRGIEAFRFCGFHTDPGTQPKVHLLTDGVESRLELQAPIRLLSEEPSSIVGSHGWEEDDEGLVTLAPDASLAIDISHGLKHGQKDRWLLRSLVNVWFPHVSLHGEPYLQRGWLIPKPISFE